MTPPNLSLLFVMICFWLAMGVVYRFLIVPVGGVVAERQRRLDDADQEWERTHSEYLEATARVEAQLEEAAREASTIRTERRQEALAMRQEALDTARQDAGDRLQQALNELDRDVAAARGELVKRARDLARLFASRLLEREVAS